MRHSQQRADASGSADRAAGGVAPRRAGDAASRCLGVAAAVILLAACTPGGKPAGPPQAPAQPVFAHDIHSHSRPDEVRVAHADIDWTIDFEARRISGSVTWTVQRAPGSEAEPLMLDVKGLSIEAVTAADGTPLNHEVAHEHPALGAALGIELPTGQDRVVIRYHTAPDAAALQWLTPRQTAGGTKPFLFSQAQSILARTMIPCQDSPGVRFTYTATVRTPPGITAVMAAKHLPGGGDGGPFRFEMPQPIPSYLVAIAAGDIAFRELGPRSGVYAEPQVLERAAWEFADTEKMMTATEALYGPYRWERYDLIVLPPSFPFGGMENPRLTFATPTVLAGDRSLVSLVAHELAHSWSGNLVTNATWSDFWLNEGFTVYLERRVLEVLYGRESSETVAVLGLQDMRREMKDLEPGFTALHNVSLEGRDPDDAFSEVPYEKGYLFVRLVEEKVGRERFDPFLRRWFDDNAFTSRTTADFETALRHELFAGEPQAMDELKVNEWLYAEGLPDNAPRAHSEALQRVADAAAAFVAGRQAAADLPAKEWSTQEWQQFLRALPEDPGVKRLAALDAAWSLSARGNAEILTEWLLHTIRSNYRPADAALEKLLTSQGRRKFLKPLYTELARTPEGKRRALAIYAKARPMYHSVSSGTIDTILGYEPGGKAAAGS